LSAIGRAAFSSRPVRARDIAGWIAHLGLRPRLLSAVPPGRARAAEVDFRCGLAVSRDAGWSCRGRTRDRRP